jgi:hypothetical protein
VVARRFERLHDDVALDLFERAEAGEERNATGGGADIFRKIFRSEFGPFAEDDGAFERIAKFANVAGPIVRGEQAAGGGAKLPTGPMVNDGERLQQKIGERKNVRAAFAQRRNRDGQNVQAEKKIFAELAGGDGGLEVGVGDGDEARFDVKRFGAAEALEGALLQNAKHFCLRVGRERGNFVENDGAGAAEFEAAEFAVHRAGEGTAFVAEEFAFDEGGRKRSAIDFEERRVAARAEFVDEPRKMIFAGAGFAGDEERGGRGGNFFREIEQTARSGVFGDPGQAVGHGDIVTDEQGRRAKEVCFRFRWLNRVCFAAGLVNRNHPLPHPLFFCKC